MIADGQKQAKGAIGNGTAVTIGFMLLVAGGIGSFAWQSATSTAELRNLTAGVVSLSSDIRTIRSEVQDLRVEIAQIKQEMKNFSHGRETVTPK